MQLIVSIGIKPFLYIVDIHQHPYCARTNEQWLGWNVGKRRASEVSTNFGIVAPSSLEIGKECIDFETDSLHSSAG